MALGLTNNVLSLVPLGLVAREELSVMEIDWSNFPWIALCLSAVFGFAISTAGLALRKLITATSFTVLANINKLGTVAIAAFLRDQPLHANAIVGLMVTLAGGAVYSLSRVPKQQQTQGKTRDVPSALRDRSNERWVRLALT